MPRPRKFDADKALDRAIDAFWRGGYDATSVDDLCDAMAIRPASLYGAYGDKRRLFHAALETYTARSQAAFAEITSVGGMAGVRAFFGRLVERMAGDEEGRGCLATNSATQVARRDAEVARLIDNHWRQLEVLLATRLNEAQDRGELAPGVGPQNAPALVCLAQGLNVMAKARPTRARLQLLVDAALQPLVSP